ncbi:MAG: 50S ribosomal protein L11 methyltransferase [Thermodesulfobacteriota bacterium]
MLRPPYTSYNRLHVYHLDNPAIPCPDDQDLIGLWVEDDTSVLFFHQPKDLLVADLCSRSGCSLIYQAELDYQDWEAGQEITAFTVADITVAPVWETDTADIRLDPSVIFGTGFHPTTRICLHTLLTMLRSPETRINSVLDLGTGTGLLAIAAALYGARQVTAIDNNPLACQVAKANCRRNRVGKQVSVQQLDLRQHIPSTKEYNLVIANLYRGLLETLFITPSFWEADYYLLSGFLPGMEGDLLAAIPGDRVRFLNRLRSDKWCIWQLANRRING